jgi:hypothetical protein
MPSIPTRRKADVIRDICERMKDAPESELEALAAQLHIELMEYSLRLENMTTASLLRWPDFPRDRRSRSLKPLPLPEPRSA